MALSFILPVFSLHLTGCKKEETGIKPFLENIYAADKPGAVVLVKLGNSPADLFVSGLADLERQAAMEPDMVFPIGSITKSFTAVSIMILKEQGKLKTSDSLTKYFPEFSPEYDEVNIGHLLSHTSGILSYNRIPEYLNCEDKSSLSLEQMKSFSKNKPLLFDPGTRFNYSNSNYIILTSIIEKASGGTYQDFVTKEILEKSGMNSTFFDISAVKGSLPLGYEYTDNSIKPSSEDTGHTFGAGMMFASAADISLFIQSLQDGVLISRESLDYLFSVPLEHKDGRPDEYAHGFWVTRIDDVRTIKMEGYCNGFFTNAFYLPVSRTQVVIFPNTSGFPRPDDPAYITRWITRYLRGEPVKILRKTEMSADILESYQGVYRIDDSSTRQVIIKEGKLYTLRTGGPIMEAFPSSEESFFYPNTFTAFTFTRNEKGDLSGMKMTDDEGIPHEASLTVEPVRKPITLDDKKLREFTGKYDFGYSIYEIKTDQNCLTVDDGWREYLLFPESENSFYPWHEDAHWVFQKDENGLVSSLTFKKGSYEQTVRKVD